MGKFLCLPAYTHPQWGNLLPLQTVHLFHLKIRLFVFKFLNEHSKLIVTDTLEIHSLKSSKVSEKKHSTSSFYKPHYTQTGNMRGKSSYLLGSTLPSMYFPMIDPDLCFQLAFGTVVLHFCRNTEYFLLIYFCCPLW